MTMEFEISLTGWEGMFFLSPETGWTSEPLLSNFTNTSCNPLLDMLLNDSKILQLLALAVSAWLGLLVVFVLIRCAAPDYSRAALATSTQWFSALYSRGAVDLGTGHSRTWSTLMYEDKHCWSWIVSFFTKLKLSDIKQRCGPDASVYLALELYLALLLSVLSFFSLFVILPINYNGGRLSIEADVFPRTTITNVSSESSLLWVHTVLSLLYLCLTVLFMLHFSLRLGQLQQDYSNQTVMVQWIPALVHREDIMQHLQEALPYCTVSDIQMAYDVSDLSTISNKLKKVSERLAEVESINNEFGVRETVLLGWRKVLCCSDRFETDARGHYESRFQELKGELEAERRRVRNSKRLGIGFITFKQQSDAKRFCSSYKPCRPRPGSSLYQSIGARWWWVSMAPFTTDILWSNLSMPYAVWWLRWLLMNSVLFVFLFFFTTPPVIIASVDEIRAYFVNISNNTDLPDLHATFGGELAKISFSSLLLLLFASLLPLVVSRTSYLEAHWTRSFREQTIMRKTYLFLVLMVIVLPSVGMTSLSALAELALDGETAIREKLQCVFLPNNGAFFVSYAIIAVFVRTGLDLLRLPELLLYLVWRGRARTRRQREGALRKAADFNFLYGLHYAWNLVIFSLVITFSLTTPLITPFGVLYFLIKHYVDRYNIYYVYKPAPFQGRQFIHRSAVNFVIVGAMILQLAMLFFSLVRLGRLDPRSLLLMVVFSLGCVMCVGVMFLGWLEHLLPRLRLRLGKEGRVFSKTRSCDQDDSEEETAVKVCYIPPVLSEAPPSLSLDNSLTGYGYQSFGSTNLMGRRSPEAGHMTRAKMSTLERSAKKSQAVREQSKYLV